MEVTYFKKNLSPQEEENFASYVKGKLPAIECLLTKFPKDGQLLKVSIEKFNKHDAFDVEFCLTLPTKSLIANEASHAITKAVDLSKDRLIVQIKKHMASLRRDRSHKSIRDTESVKEKVEIWE
jgi:ribosome-associated translation inhibitor RaiA